MKSLQEEFHEGRPLCPAGGLDVRAEGVERPAQAEGVTMRRDDAALWAVSGGFVHVSTQLPLPAVRPLKTVHGPTLAATLYIAVEPPTSDLP